MSRWVLALVVATCSGSVPGGWWEGPSAACCCVAAVTAADGCKGKSDAQTGLPSLLRGSSLETCMWEILSKCLARGDVERDAVQRWQPDAFPAVGSV